MSKDKGVTALEAYDLARPFRSQLDEQCIDLGLLHRVRAIALPYIVEAGSRGDELDNTGRDESIIDDDLSRGDQFVGTTGKELGVTRTSSDEIYGTHAVVIC